MGPVSPPVAYNDRTKMYVPAGFPVSRRLSTAVTSCTAVVPASPGHLAGCIALKTAARPARVDA